MSGQDAGSPSRFERLILLRRAYPLRSSYVRRAIMSVAAPLDHGEWRMRLVRTAELRHGHWMARRGA